MKTDIKFELLKALHAVLFSEDCLDQLQVELISKALDLDKVVIQGKPVPVQIEKPEELPVSENLLIQKPKIVNCGPIEYTKEIPFLKIDNSYYIFGTNRLIESTDSEYFIEKRLSESKSTFALHKKIFDQFSPVLERGELHEVENECFEYHGYYKNNGEITLKLFPVSECFVAYFMDKGKEKPFNINDFCNMDKKYKAKISEYYYLHSETKLFTKISCFDKTQEFNSKSTKLFFNLESFYSWHGYTYYHCKSRKEILLYLGSFLVPETYI